MCAMKKCSIVGCSKKHYGNGFCVMHYTRNRSHGTPHMSMRGTKRPLFEKLMSKVVTSDGCWEWLGSKDKNGYGSIRCDSGTKKAHRVSYLVHVGEIPSGLYVLHKCDNPSCVSPHHLFLGTHRDNMRDMWSKGRGKAVSCGRKGSKNGNSRLSEGDVIEIRLRLSCGESGASLSREYGVSKNLIYLIRDKKVWTHI